MSLCIQRCANIFLDSFWKHFQLKCKHPNFNLYFITPIFFYLCSVHFYEAPAILFRAIDRKQPNSCVQELLLTESNVMRFHSYCRYELLLGCSARDSISSYAGNSTSGKFVQNRCRVWCELSAKFLTVSTIVYSLALGSTKSPLTSTQYPVDQAHALISAQQTVERTKAHRRGFFCNELLEIWYQCGTYSCCALWPFICLQTAASFLRAWPGASDDVMRSVKDLDWGSNCAENSISDTLCLPCSELTHFLPVFPFYGYSASSDVQLGGGLGGGQRWRIKMSFILDTPLRPIRHWHVMQKLQFLSNCEHTACPLQTPTCLMSLMAIIVWYLKAEIEFMNVL